MHEEDQLIQYFCRIAVLSVISILLTGAAHGDEILAGRGIWVQAPQNLVVAALEGYKDLGVRRIHVMVAASPKTYASCSRETPQILLAKPQRLAEVVRAGKAAGLVVIVTAYMPPNRLAIETFTDPADDAVLMKLLAAGADGVEYDLEGGWSKSAVCGYANHETASQALLGRTRALRAGLRAGITTHLGRVHDGKLGLASADWVTLQTYTKCDLTSGACPSFDDKGEGPGFRQTRAASAIADYKGPILMGLANYFQAWPAHVPSEAMGKALAATLEVQKKDARFVGHTYWSTSWLGAEGVRDFMRASAK